MLSPHASMQSLLLLSALRCATSPVTPRAHPHGDEQAGGPSGRKNDDSRRANISDGGANRRHRRRGDGHWTCNGGLNIASHSASSTPALTLPGSPPPAFFLPRHSTALHCTTPRHLRRTHLHFRAVPLPFSPGASVLLRRDRLSTKHNSYSLPRLVYAHTAQTIPPPSRGAHSYFARQRTYCT